MVLDLMAGMRLAPALSRVVFATVKGKKGNDGLPSDDPGYMELLAFMRQNMAYTACNTVDDIQRLTRARIPYPSSVITQEVEIPSFFYDEAARHIQDNLGPKNLNMIGKTWWQWRKPGSVVKAEWVEMKEDALERKRKNDPGNKVMFYVHGGAYYLGEVGHHAQFQRHARKLHGRVFAVRYRLAPQFPFPCAVHDVVSSYLYLLSIQDPSTIVIAGDSAGGGLCLALLIILRDQGLPMPVGASLISPWVDLTHSFPSITIDSKFDYVPSTGFHAKPSISWPPPNTDEMKILGWPKHPGALPDYEATVDGERVVLTEQLQIYAENNHLTIPLVSPVLAASLGGFCPIQVIVGGGEVLRDEQIYLAHKAANPAQYPPCDEYLERNGNTMADVTKYPPTDVHLLVFDDCPHAAPTLGHTRGAMYQYRSISQFAAWALARAQKEDIEIEDDSSIKSNPTEGIKDHVGKAGDPLPHFVDHMIRQRVDRDGKLHPLKPASELRACNIPKDEIGKPRAEALNRWFEYRKNADIKYASQKRKVWEQRLKYSKIGYERFPDGEVPPPSALAGRRVIGQSVESGKKSSKIFSIRNLWLQTRSSFSASGSLLTWSRNFISPFINIGASSRKKFQGTFSFDYASLDYPLHLIFQLQKKTDADPTIGETLVVHNGEVEVRKDVPLMGIVIGDDSCRNVAH